MKSPEIRMYNALKPSLGEEDAQVFIEANNESVAAKIEIMKSDLATRGNFYDLKLELEQKMQKMHTELLKAIYVTGLTQTIIIIGAVLAIMKSNS